MSELTIREIGQDDDFAHWFHELLEAGADDAAVGPADDRYLVLCNEIGDWIGGLRFSLRGGVAQLIEIGIAPAARSQGHAHRLLAAFERRATEDGAHLAEFWTDDFGAEGLLSALGWRRVMLRDAYLGGRQWLLLEKPLNQA